MSRLLKGLKIFLFDVLSQILFMNVYNKKFVV